MLKNILQFELRYWLRRPMPYVFLLINALMVFFAMTSDNITIGQSYGSVQKNAPFVVQNMYAFMSLLMLLMATAFVQGAALRDFTYNSHQIVFSTPLRKFPYLMGRFLGASLVAMVPLLGVTLAGLASTFAVWLEPSQLGPINWSAHLWGLLLFVIPNTLLIAAIIFSIAVLTRSTIASFVGAIGVLVLYGVAGSWTSDLDNEQLAMLLDPFGLTAFQLMTKYWTVADKNSMVLGLEGMMLANRLIWMGVAGLIWLLAYFGFSFSPRSRKGKAAKAGSAERPAGIAVLQPLPSTRLGSGFGLHLRQMLSQARIDFIGILKSAPFIVILLFGLINMAANLTAVSSSYGLSLYPVTYRVIDNIRGGMYLSTLAIIIFYAGALVWKERDAKVDEIYNSLPYPNWVPVLSKVMAMVGVIVALQLLTILAGVSAQALMGYYRFEIGTYAAEFLVLDLLSFFFFAVLAMLIHTLVNNKYLAYFVFIVIVIVNGFIWAPLDIESNMLRFGATPSYTYSDMNGFGPFVLGLFGFNLYWLLFSLLLIALVIAFWMRTKDTAWGKRWGAARGWMASNRASVFGLFGLWLISAVWVFYNTQVINDYDTEKASRKLSAEYEKQFKYLVDKPQPQIIDLKYEIDLYPERRDAVVRAQLQLVNRSGRPVDTLIANLPEGLDFELEVQQAKLVKDDETFSMQHFQFDPPMQPGDTLMLSYTARLDTRGFENELSSTQFVSNGSFFNNYSITPSFGYEQRRELSQKRHRKKYGLPEQENMPPLERDCKAACRHHYLSPNADWVTVAATISTAKGQTAIAPGSLLRQWEDEGRDYFHYRLDHPSMNFYSFISAEYELAQEDWQDVSLEVYYQKGHEYNVENMLRSMRNSLAYYAEHFSPYRHKQARIIEFPRYASFAQAFPGTMPYSEGIGFIAKIEEAENDIDMVYYVVAHEMAHQWWAHQVMGANMQGATLLSETLAQYSALMVMEREYGREQMRKFLKYEMDRYLRGRGSETEREKPLMEVYAGQGYIHYQKGSAVMYYLKEMIGEEQVNSALRSLIADFAYQPPPYPTAHHLVDALRERTPDSLQYLITDMFETITLFDNRIQDPVCQELEDGRYELSFTAYAAKFRADSTGVETEIPVQDYIDVGVYAKPEKEGERGPLLYTKRQLITERETPFTIVLDELPHEAGFDPNYYLIDRMPMDNVKRVKMAD